MNTDQFNLRLSLSLLFDLEFISRATGISKNEWVRYNLAKTIHKEKEDLLGRIELDFVTGRKTEQEYREIVCIPPREDLKIQREAHHQKMTKLLDNKSSKKFARKALLTLKQG